MEIQSKKEGEATYGARQPISLQTAPTKRSRFLIKKIYEQLADTQKSEAREVGLLKVSPCSNCISNDSDTKTTINPLYCSAYTKGRPEKNEEGERERSRSVSAARDDPLLK